MSERLGYTLSAIFTVVYLIFHSPPLSGPFRSMIPLSFNSDIYLAIVLSVTSKAILHSSIEIFGFSEIIFRISHALASFFLEYSGINFLIFSSEISMTFSMNKFLWLSGYILRLLPQPKRKEYNHEQST